METRNRNVRDRIGVTRRTRVEHLEPRLLFSTVLGTFGASAGKLVHALPDGTKLTFSLTAGTGTLSQDDAGALGVSTTGTTPASNLSVSVAGKTKVAPIGSVVADAALGTINFAKASLASGTLTVAGDVKTVTFASVTSSAMTFNGTAPMSLSVGNVNDSTIQSSAPFTSLKCNAFLSSSAHVSAITAPWIGALTCGVGEFLADLTLSGAGAPGGVALKTAKIGGDIFHSTWSIAGNVDSLTVNTGFDVGFNGDISGNVKTLKVGNSIDAANLTAANFGAVSIGNGMSIGHLLAGTHFGADGVFGGGDDTFAAGSIGSFKVRNSLRNKSLVAAGLVNPDDTFPVDGDESLLPGSSIGPVSVNNTLTADSHILASTLPATAKIHVSKISTASDPRFNLV